MKAEEWIQAILAGKGKVPLSSLLAREVPLAALRGVALEHGLKPKGFRVERAGADQLGELLAEHFVRDTVVQQQLAELLASSGADSGADRPPAAAPPGWQERAAALERELGEARARVKKERQSAAKARATTHDAIQKRAATEARATELRARLQDLARELEAKTAQLAALEARRDQEGAAQRDRAFADLAARVAELEARDEAARRKNAELMSRIRAVEEENDELESLLPRGQRERRKHGRRGIASETTAILLPRFSADFLRDLAGLGAEQERRVFAAVARLVLQGLDYPGLHAKALKGMRGLISIRASESLRIYLEREGDEAKLKGVATREQQATYLKKWKDS